MTRYRIIYPPNQDSFGWKVDGYEHLSNRVGSPVPWAHILVAVPALITHGIRPLKVVKVPETATRWHD